MCVRVRYPLGDHTLAKAPIRRRKEQGCKGMTVWNETYGKHFLVEFIVGVPPIYDGGRHVSGVGSRPELLFSHRRSAFICSTSQASTIDVLTASWYLCIASWLRRALHHAVVSQFLQYDPGALIYRCTWSIISENTRKWPAYARCALLSPLSTDVRLVS